MVFQQATEYQHAAVALRQPIGRTPLAVVCGMPSSDKSTRAPQTPGPALSQQRNKQHGSLEVPHLSHLYHPEPPTVKPLAFVDGEPLTACQQRPDSPNMRF
ncbi:hypothetical protein P171DRAFT_65964 [Karstenula rhodostoma CBS 690.94]|uniref:Uncharacterized protein n=1 Tax=Karstenula rhodostoma CBS 690.94 TaxID=1392251 RepID=A0A9P4UAL2_9PLEO|nr:hypothetical protein P171DRAFT_65964 [Karstenula rhodostoma CBS 690.94]